MTEKGPDWVDKTVDSKLLLLLQRVFILALVPFLLFFARYSWDTLQEVKEGNVRISSDVLLLRGSVEGESKQNAFIHELIDKRLSIVESTRYRPSDAERDFAPRDQRLSDIERRLNKLESED